MRRPRAGPARACRNLWLNPPRDEQRPLQAPHLVRHAGRHRRAHDDRRQPDRVRDLREDLRRGSARVMADERDDQATQVGHQVVPEESDGQDTAVRSTQADADVSAETPAGGEPEGQAKTEVFFQTARPGDPEEAPPPPVPRAEPRAPSSPAEADRMAADAQDPFAEKPHVYALGA